MYVQAASPEEPAARRVAALLHNPEFDLVPHVPPLGALYTGWYPEANESLKRVVDWLKSKL